MLKHICNLEVSQYEFSLRKRNDKRKLFVNDKTYDTLKTNYLDDYNKKRIQMKREIVDQVFRSVKL